MGTGAKRIQAWNLLGPRAGRVPGVGVLCGRRRRLRFLQRLRTSLPSPIGQLAVHWWHGGANFTAATLLGEPFVRGPMDDYAQLKAWAPHLRPPRVTEGNNMNRGGTEGVSDSFAAALWTADWAFELAAAG